MQFTHDDWETAVLTLAIAVMVSVIFGGLFAWANAMERKGRLKKREFDLRSFVSGYNQALILVWSITDEAASGKGILWSDPDPTVDCADVLDKIPDLINSMKLKMPD